MRVVTFATNQDEERLGVWTERGFVDVVAAARASHRAEPGDFADVLTFLRVGKPARPRLAHLVDWAHRHLDAGHLLAANEVRLLAPIPRPPKVLFLAGNYAEHWREGGKDAPPRANHTPRCSSNQRRRLSDQTPRSGGPGRSVPPWTMKGS